MGSVNGLVAEGAAALARGDWTGARRHFETVLEHEETAAASAALHLARGETVLAGAVLERRLDALGDGLPAVPLLRLLVEVQLALGEITPARTAAERLSAIAERAKQSPIHAQASLSAARVALASGSAAEALFERACTLFEASGMPFETAVTRLEWAEVLDTADRAIAAEDARLAHESSAST